MRNSGTEIEKMTRQMHARSLGCICFFMLISGLMSAISNDSAASNFNKDNTDHFGNAYCIEYFTPLRISDFHIVAYEKITLSFSKSFENP